jgi:hypothetical protein
MSEALTESATDVVHVQSDLVPPAKHKVTITVRLEPSQHDAWKRAAEAIDRPLEYWIRSFGDKAAAKAGFRFSARQRTRKPRKRSSPHAAAQPRKRRTARRGA